ncbi:Mpo1 family 2-hydroxy fatty acid dioxygenase [Gilvimarinus sp. F26214L]|uniref:Mpo1 family 2-hydroxy fatty acid dioxygenase n=1 Tax=Gilvimarinus sp. DZF01 TaxID=3461371 RepID=UPI0040460F42
MLNKTVNEWLLEYGESHQNPTNKLIHWICVPVIFWCVLALLWEVQVGNNPWLNAAVLATVLSVLFYLRLSATLALGMAVISAACLLLIRAYESSAAPWPLWQFALALFVLAWIGQFVGHKVEGKKPSFFKDLQFLLIGPAWLLSFVYRKLGIPLTARAEKLHGH